MNRSILIVTPFFAPQTHAAVFRAYKLAKYLPRYGWKPYVVTTDINYLYNEDPSLLDALPSEVEIYRTHYVEPSIRGLRMALGGKDRTFKALKVSREVNKITQIEVDSEQGLPSLTSRLYTYLQESYLQSPDAHWTWERPTVQKATDIIHQHDIPLILTSADPFTSHRIGYQLQKNTDVCWIADFRDPHTHSYWMYSHNLRVFGKQRQAEYLAVSHADAVTTAAESIALILTETYGLDCNHPTHFIPTGLDENLVTTESDIELPDSPYLIFVGEFLAGYGDQFFRIFEKVLQNLQVKATGVQLIFIGRKDINEPLLVPLIEMYHLEECVEIIDHVPQQVLYTYLKGAKATLLIPGYRAGWWRLYAKLIDYIALRKPTIAIVPEPSEARVHLQKSGLGIFLDGDEEKAVQQLTEFLLKDNVNLHVDKDYCDQFLAQSQVKAFVELFEGLI